MFGRFRKKPQLHPDYPVVEGRYDMTPEWAIELPLPFNRRFEENNLVLWRPGITAWIVVWGNDQNASVEARLSALKSRRSPDAFGPQEFSRDGVGYHFYRLLEAADDARVAAGYAFAFGPAGHVQMAVYFDNESDLPIAEALWRGIRPCPPER